MRAGRRMPGLWMIAGIAVLRRSPPPGCRPGRRVRRTTGPAGGYWTRGNWGCGHVPDTDDDVTLAGTDSVTGTAPPIAGTPLDRR